MTGDDVVAEARRWLGTPWVHQRRQFGIAVDCAGLLICVARSLRIVPEDFDVNGYGRRPDGTLLSICDEHMTRIDKESMRPGDALVMSVGRDPQHLGIVGNYRHGGLSLIHACSTSTPPSVVEHRLVFTKALKFVRAYRFNSLV